MAEGALDLGLSLFISSFKREFKPIDYQALEASTDTLHLLLQAQVNIFNPGIDTLICALHILHGALDSISISRWRCA